MSRIFRDNCKPPAPTYGEPRPISLANAELSLKREHVLVGDNYGSPREVKLNAEDFVLQPLDCDTLELRIKELDHGELQGLGDDDHTQYVHVSLDRTISANHDFTGSVGLLGEVRDSTNNQGAPGQVAVSTGSGFQWRTQSIENVYWVSKDGNDANNGLSPQSAKASIKAAVRSAYSGYLGKLQDAAEQIFANKRLIQEEAFGYLLTRNFVFPNSTSFDLKTRSAYNLIVQNIDSIVSGTLSSVSSDPNFNNVSDKCERDTRFVVLSVAKDILFGGYENISKVLDFYFTSNGVLRSSIFTPEEKDLTITAYQQLIIQIQTYLVGSTFEYIRFKVEKLIGYLITALLEESLQNIPSSVTQEQLKYNIYYEIDSLVQTAWSGMVSQVPGIAYQEEFCKRDLKYVATTIAEDIGSFGFSNSIKSARAYFPNSTSVFNNSLELNASRVGIELLKNAILALSSNQSLSSHIESAFAYIEQTLILEDTSWIVDVDTGNCNDISRLCFRDLGLFIDAIGSDLKNGGNVFSVEFAEAYFDGNNLLYINDQLEDTIAAFNKTRELMIHAMRNWRIDSLGNFYSPEYSVIKPYVDNSLVVDVSWPSCSDIEQTINNYFGIIQYILLNGPNADAKRARDLIYEAISKGDSPDSIVYRIWEATSDAYPEIEYTESKCKRDLIYILEAIAKDLYSTGNSNILSAARAYFNGSGQILPSEQVSPASFAYQQIEIILNTEVLADSAFDGFRSRITELISILNNAITSGDISGLPEEDVGTWSVQPPSFKTTIFVNPGVYIEDNPITLPPNTVITGDSLRGITVRAKNRTQDLFYVNNASGLSFMTFSDHLAPSYAVSFPQKNGQGIAGIISRSPYVQQCTSLTTTGGGMLVDGNLTGGFKSMVLDSFTQYNQGGDGVRIVNNGYAQLVSLFTISCSNGVFCGTGGQCDLTNSNSSFGDYGLVADGVGETEIIATVPEDIPSGTVRFKIKLPGKLRPYNGQVGYFGAPYYTIADIKILDPGFGYERPPIVQISSPTGPNAIPGRARAILNDTTGVGEITVLRGGTSFIQPPTITIDPPTLPGGYPPVIQLIMQPIYYTVTGSTNPDENNEVIVTIASPTNYEVKANTSFVLARQSKVLASGHSFEYIGAGANIFNALPINNGTFVQQQEIDARNGGAVIYTSTDQSGNFRIGDGVIIDQATGTIGGVSFSRGLFAQITPLILSIQ